MMPANTLEKLLQFMIPVTESGCWLWLRPVDRKGYGHFRVKGHGKPSAHRASWILHGRKISEGMHILHKCDVPSCVNPNHLFLGTNLDNIADKMRKGRHRSPVGERSGNAKLTAEQVLYIRNSTKSIYALAREFGVWHPAISKIKLRQRWKHLP